MEIVEIVQATPVVEAIETIDAPPSEVRPEKQNSDQRKGKRGTVGPHNIKGLFHSFQRREGRKARGVSLKAFAHQIAENGTDEEKIVALDWLKNKSGALEKKQRADRQKNKGAQLIAIRQASKNKKSK